jgi:hypothetical protein
MEDSVRVVLDAGSRAWRRRLGPMAWAVLEDLAFDAQTGEAGVPMARTSARRVAEHLDIQPGTAARALRLLRDEQVVTLVREPGAAGRFGLSVYRLAEIAGIHLVDGQPCVDPPLVATPYVTTPHVATPHVATPRTVRSDADRPNVDRPRSVERGAAAPRVAAPPEGGRCGASPASERQGWGWRRSDVGEPVGRGVVVDVRADIPQGEGSGADGRSAGASPTRTPTPPGREPIRPVQLSLFDDRDPSSAGAAGLRSLS